MKPFDLEAAKAGKPVCTRDGHDVRILAFDALGSRPIVALAKISEGVEVPITCTLSGFVFGKNSNDCHDLMMASEKRKGWINIYKYVPNENRAATSGYIYESKEIAISKAVLEDNYVGTFLVEWEE